MKNENISEIIRNFLEHIENEFFTLNELITLLKERSFGILILLIALPNAFLIAAIPGISTIFGLMLIFVSFQMILQRKKIWLPKRLGHKKFSKKHFEHILTVSNPYLSRVEKNLKLRWKFLTSLFFERILGFICLVHGILIALPIPLGNFLSGTSLVFLALGTIFKDGLFILIGYVLSVLVFSFFSTIFIKIGESIFG